ncbi:insulinase family protein [Pedobacter yulinensis]|uniref:Insulinase family protein n=1 Tax=Pedobacter yulinensis TaxID=2126353 RepID=A0A2T3HI61_9SPHI|nr:pitrilysin family protein [Pedobacter yulinensis]PST82122.1 insulinase family protein [Pedobacter yulinensis]
MLNRTEAPAFGLVSDIQFIKPEHRTLRNGIPVFSLVAGGQDLVRIEFIFENVDHAEGSPLQSMAVNNLLNNGTATRSAREIAESVDFYGAFLQTDYNPDHASLTLYTLTKHLEAVLPIVHDVLTGSTFPADELDIFARNQKQKLLVNLKKNDFVARRLFSAAVLGNTPYGYVPQPEDYDQLDRGTLLRYFAAGYSPENCTIVAAGKFDERSFNLLDRFFGADWEVKEKAAAQQFTPGEPDARKIYQEVPDALQSALRLGTLTINRRHPDFPALQVLNCVLGGYFGSRLMANIREDKGFTYGIGSGLASLKHAGYFFISTEVGAEVSQAALNEIYSEISLLQSAPVAGEELSLVRNYMMGSLLGSLENVFSHADKFKNVHFSGMDYDYYSNYIETIRTVSAERLQHLAQTYLRPEQFVEVTVGKK